MYQHQRQSYFMKLSGNEPHKIRLQVFLSRNGVCSRRRAMDIVKEGHVQLNGQVCCEPSTLVDPGKDHVVVDDKKIHGRKYEYVLLNKPDGYMTTKADPHADRTVFDILPPQFHHLSPVGRLDRDTEGLLLLTNDGDVAYRLTHPKFNIEKVYYACLDGELLPEKKGKIERGIYIEGQKTAPAKIRVIKASRGKTELMVTIHEGRKRQIRIMFAKEGYKVSYLKRVAQGPLSLGTLKRGCWRLLDRWEIDKLTRL